MLKKTLSSKYPALQLEMRPGILKKALERGVYWGYVTLVSHNSAASSGLDVTQVASLIYIYIYKLE